MKRITLEVKHHHIAKGIRFKPSSCPIALALKKKFPKRHICVGPDLCVIGHTYYHLSKKAKEFVEAFDKGFYVPPTVFSLKFWRTMHRDF